MLFACAAIRKVAHCYQVKPHTLRLCSCARRALRWSNLLHFWWIRMEQFQAAGIWAREGLLPQTTRGHALTWNFPLCAYALFSGTKRGSAPFLYQLRRLLALHRWVCVCVVAVLGPFVRCKYENASVFHATHGYCTGVTSTKKKKGRIWRGTCKPTVVFECSKQSPARIMKYIFDSLKLPFSNPNDNNI